MTRTLVDSQPEHLLRFGAETETQSASAPIKAAGTSFGRAPLVCSWHQLGSGGLTCTWRHIDPNDAALAP